MNDTNFAELSRSLFEEFQIQDLSRFTAMKGVELSSDTLHLHLYDGHYFISPGGVKTSESELATPAISVLLLSYLLNYPESIPHKGKWMTFREFSGAGPLTGHFTENTNKIITSTFSGKSDLLLSRALIIGGVPNTDSSAYDLSIIFKALSAIDVQLTFNDKEDLFPAQCSLLFRESAECFLNLKMIGVLATLLTGKLIQE